MEALNTTDAPAPWFCRLEGEPGHRAEERILETYRNSCDLVPGACHSTGEGPVELNSYSRPVSFFRALGGE